MLQHTRGCCPRACSSSTWLAVTAATQPDPVVHHAGGCGPFGCYPACEGHELPQHGATEARVLSTLQLRCRQDTLELHVGSLQQDGSSSWLQPPRTLHPGRVCTPGPWARQAEGDPGGIHSAGYWLAGAHPLFTAWETPALPARC